MNELNEPVRLWINHTAFLTENKDYWKCTCDRWDFEIAIIRKYGWHGPVVASFQAHCQMECWMNAQKGIDEINADFHEMYFWLKENVK